MRYNLGRSIQLERRKWRLRERIQRSSGIPQPAWNIPESSNNSNGQTSYLLFRWLRAVSTRGWHTPFFGAQLPYRTFEEMRNKQKITFGKRIKLEFLHLHCRQDRVNSSFAKKRAYAGQLLAKGIWEPVRRLRLVVWKLSGGYSIK